MRRRDDRGNGGAGRKNVAGMERSEGGDLAVGGTGDGQEGEVEIGLLEVLVEPGEAGAKELELGEVDSRFQGVLLQEKAARVQLNENITRVDVIAFLDMDGRNPPANFANDLERAVWRTNETAAPNHCNCD